MNDAPRMIPQEPAPTTMVLVHEIRVHHDIALTLSQLAELIGNSIGYQHHCVVLLNVIETELHAAAASMTALTEKIRDCLDEGE
jgi:hypothetical protein